MRNEILTTFDDLGNITGKAPRDEVHRLGYWHETFHCWFVSNDQGIPYIYLQLRSDQKKDYAGLLDITAAGHLLSHETVEDGIREVQEELGLDISFEELIPLGTIPYSMKQEGLIDNERAHVFLYNNLFSLSDFQLQQEEVAGIVKAKLSDFRNLWLGEQHILNVEGFRIDETGQKISINQNVDKTHFVPHELDYYARIIDSIESIF